MCSILYESCCIRNRQSRIFHLLENECEAMQQQRSTYSITQKERQSYKPVYEVSHKIFPGWTMNECVRQKAQWTRQHNNKVERSVRVILGLTCS